MTLRSLLYRGARLLGDAQAIRRGPRAIGRRLVRRRLWRRAGGLINRLVR